MSLKCQAVDWDGGYRGNMDGHYANVGVAGKPHYVGRLLLRCSCDFPEGLVGYRSRKWAS